MREWRRSRGAKREAIPAADLLAQEDEADRDGDGISGRASVVPSAELGRPALGRFGLKAGAATVRDQTAAAFSFGITPIAACASQAWASISNQMRNLVSGDQMATISGRE